MFQYRSLRLMLLLILLSSCSKTVHQVQPLKTDLNNPRTMFHSKVTNFNASTRISEFSSNGEVFKLIEIGNNLSGITWDPFTQQYLALQNNSAIIYRYDRNFNFLGKVKKIGKIHNDTEGISYFDASSLLIATESNVAHRVKLNKNAKGKDYYNSIISFQLSERPLVKNKGLEGIAIRPGNSARPIMAFAAQEGSGRSVNAQMKVFSFNPLLQSSMLSNQYSYSDDALELSEPFSAEQELGNEITDISGLTFDPSGETLIILSHESKKALQVVPETGKILSILNLKGLPVYEGVTIGPAGELVFVSERNWVQVYTNKLKLQ